MKPIRSRSVVRVGRAMCRVAVLVAVAVLLAPVLAAGAKEPVRSGKPAPTCLFDGKTLKGWKIAGEYDFKDHGKVLVRGGRLVLEKGRPFTGVQWTGRFPRIDYEVSLDAMRVEGDDFFCSMVFPIGKSNCSLTFGGWGGSIIGLTNIDGEPAVENETCIDKEFKNNRWYRIRLRVTGEKIEVWLDKEKLVDFAHQDHKLDLRWEQEPLLPFGISSYRTTAAVRNVAVRRIGGKAADEPKEFSVEKTYNDAPFRYQMRLTSTKQGYRIYRLTYPSPVTTPLEANNTVPADYYLPDGIEPGDPKRPAVVCIHILHGNFALVRMLCTSLASRGVPAIMFKLPYYGERSLPGGRGAMVRDPKLFAESLTQGIQDARRTFDVLASRPEIDPRRIGITGISLGGLVSAATAGSDARFARVVLILAGGDLPMIIGHCREARGIRELLEKLPAGQRAKVEAAIRGVDPLRHAAGLRDRAMAGKVMMINAAEDNVIPPACTKKLAEALGIADRVVWLEGLGHYTAIAALPRVMRTTVDFFAEDMPPGAQPPAPPKAASPSPARVVASLITQAASFLTKEPGEGRCHLVDLEASVTDKGGKHYKGSIRFVRGVGHRFRLQLDVPALGKASLGQGDFPWIASAKTAFCGTRGPGDGPVNPLAHADPKYTGKIRMLAGGLAGISLAPSILEQAITIGDDTPEGKSPAIRLTRKGKKDNVRLVLSDDRKAPLSATFDVEGVRGEVSFRAWQSDTVAHDALFEPPDGLGRQEVGRDDVCRIFSSMFNFAMEMTQ